jgi:hypothetical protein
MAVRGIKTRGAFDRTAGADLFRHTLSRIPSVFGQLLYLSSLRDPNTGAYRHYGLAAAFGRDQSAAALETSHAHTFREWTKLSLREKHGDLVTYLDTLEDPNGVVVQYWLESKGYIGCVPASASEADRALYTTDLRKLLTVVDRRERTTSSTGGAS